MPGQKAKKKIIKYLSVRNMLTSTKQTHGQDTKTRTRDFFTLVELGIRA